MSGLRINPGPGPGAKMPTPITRAASGRRGSPRPAGSPWGATCRGEPAPDPLRAARQPWLGNPLPAEGASRRPCAEPALLLRRAGTERPPAPRDTAPLDSSEPPTAAGIGDELSPAAEPPPAPAPPGLTPEPPAPCVTPSPPRGPPAGGTEMTWAHPWLSHPPTQPGQIKARAGNQSM